MKIIFLILLFFFPIFFIGALTEFLEKQINDVLSEKSKVTFDSIKISRKKAIMFVFTYPMGLPYILFFIFGRKTFLKYFYIGWIGAMIKDKESKLPEQDLINLLQEIKNSIKK